MCRAASSRKRRRTLVGVVVAVFAASLMTACQSLDTTESGGHVTDDTAYTVVTGMRNFAPTWGQEVQSFWLIYMTVQAPQVDRLAEPSRPGNVVVYCAVEIRNEGDRPFEFASGDFALYAGDISFEPGGADGSVVTASEPSLLSITEGSVAPGETVRGALAFEMSPELVSSIDEFRFSHLGGPGRWIAEWGD